MNNLQEIQELIKYIETHLLDEKLDLTTLSIKSGYSKFHLHRMFTAIVGVPIHTYIQRRRLTEAANMLVHTNKSIFEIALDCCYETQQSFTRAFKAMYKHNPHSYRRKSQFIPLQLQYHYSQSHKISQTMILDVKIVHEDKILLIGYDGDTKQGFRVIGKCWHQLHKNKTLIKNRTDSLYLLGVNDYTEFENNDTSPHFHYIAAAQVNSHDLVPKNMKSFTLLPSQYIVFYLRAKNEDSMQPAIEYIYQEWFPQTNYHFNENNCYDFIKYGEIVDELGQSEIQIWVPIL